MRITVIGASGPTGKVFCQLATERGHDVAAYVRSAERMAGVPAAKVYAGGPFDAATLEPAVEGSQAVLIAFGLKGARRTPLYSKGTQLVVDTMHRLGPRRLVVVSEAAYAPHLAGWLARTVSSAYHLTQRPIITERRLQDDIVTTSGLDWTIVRPGLLTDAPASTAASASLEPFRRFTRVSRTALCLSILEWLSDPDTFGHDLYY
ncbi:NADH-flavin reductase [Rhizocola hellebori]|uniref:NADH-flavin reductase n=1 Tax=Rhizocola hellebori TaxID=1392758 RepID=A0A8J3VGX6_9ACTN|nr:NAD(P)-binding oxidoreductase [Rhizocola hellebori]GIH06819.1 NADH-flavin reductase [Rhizocola hellebori]